MEDQSSKPTKPYTVLVDADAFVAFVKEDDTNHEQAKRIFAALEAKPIVFFTSKYLNFAQNSGRMLLYRT